MPQIPALFKPPVRDSSSLGFVRDDLRDVDDFAWVEDQGTSGIIPHQYPEGTVQLIAAQLLTMWRGLGETVGIGSAGTDQAEIGGRLLPVVARDFARRLMDSPGVNDLSQWTWTPGTVVAWTPEGKGNVSLIAARENRLVPVWASSSDASRIRAVAIGLSVAFLGIPQVIGSAVLGPTTAAAYPLATQAFGSFVTQTALNGGDVEAAARSALASFGGAQFGDVVGTGLDSVAVGKAAAAAATAALQGGDVETAVLRSLVFSGAQAMDDVLIEDVTSTGMTDLPTFDDWSGIDWSTVDWQTVDWSSSEWTTLDDLGVDPGTVDTSEILADNSDTMMDYGIDASVLFPDEYASLYLASGEFVELSDVVFADSIYMDEEGNIRAPDNSIMIPSDEALNATVDQLSAEIARQMDAAQGTVETSQPAPPSRPAAIPPAASQTKWPTISDTTKLLDAVGKLSAQLKSTANAIKTGTYRPPAGGTSTVGTPRNTPVGVPVTLPDGRVVVNNGNGTQTIRNPDGTTSTIPSGYSGASGAGGSLLPGVSNQALLIGGAVLIGAVLLARRR